jgi:hypothetical protein
MKPKEPSDVPLEEGPNPRRFPRINKLARISFFIGIGDIIGFFISFLETGMSTWFLCYS